MTNKGLGSLDLAVEQLGGGTSSLINGGILPRPVFTFLNKMKAGNGFTLANGTGTLSQDTVDYAIDPECLRYVGSGDGVQMRLRNTSQIPNIQSDVNYVGLLIKISDVNNLTSLSVLLGQDTSNHFVYNIRLHVRNIKENEWNWIWLDLSNPSSTVGAPTRNNQDFVQISMTESNSIAITLRVQAIAQWPMAANGTIIIIHDDGRSGVAQLGIPYLNDNDLLSTQAIIPSTIGNPGIMTVNQVRSCQKDGHEMILHNATNPDFLTASAETIKKSIENEMKIAREKGLLINQHFAIPGGALNQTVVETVPGFFTTSRNTQEYPMPQPPPRFDLISIATEAKASIAVGTVTAAIDRVMNENGCAIILVHDVEPSGAADPNINLADYKLIVDHIVNNYPTQVKTLSGWIASL